jgi:hypothetical protein
MHTVAFPPSSTALAVPLWRLNNLHTYKGPWFSGGPLFLPYFSASQQKMLQRIAGMRKRALKSAFESIISLSVDAHGGSLPVPPH